MEKKENPKNEIICKCGPKELAGMLGIWALGSFEFEDYNRFDCLWWPPTAMNDQRDTVLMEHSIKIVGLQVEKKEISFFGNNEWSIWLYLRRPDNDILRVLPEESTISVLKDNLGKDLTGKGTVQEKGLWKKNHSGWLPFTGEKRQDPFVAFSQFDKMDKGFKVKVTSKGRPNPTAASVHLVGELKVEYRTDKFAEDEEIITIAPIRTRE